MRDLWENGLLIRILAVVAITILLGLSPLPHIVETGFFRAGRTQASGAHLETARNLALVAEHLPWRSLTCGNPPAGRLWQGQTPNWPSPVSNRRPPPVHSRNAGYLRFGEAYQAAGNPYSARQVWQAANRIFGPPRRPWTASPICSATPKIIPPWSRPSSSPTKWPCWRPANPTGPDRTQPGIGDAAGSGRSGRRAPLPAAGCR